AVIKKGAHTPSFQDEVRQMQDGEGNHVGEVDLSKLTSALHRVNREPHHLPEIVDFLIDESDIRAYQAKLRDDVLEIDSLGNRDLTRDDSPFAPEAERRDLFYSLPTMLDTISPDVVAAAL